MLTMKTIEMIDNGTADEQLVFYAHSRLAQMNEKECMLALNKKIVLKGLHKSLRVP